MNETTILEDEGFFDHTDPYNTPGEFDIWITRVECRRVQAENSDDAIDRALEGEGSVRSEDTIDIDVQAVDT